MKWCTLVLVALVFARALSPDPSSAQESQALLIEPSSGGGGSRFQIVGRAGWTAGETVALHVSFETAADATQAEPDPPTFETRVLVLMDGTWSFPIVVDAIFGAPLPREPGTIVVRATSPSQTATATYSYSGAAAPNAGFGPGAPGANMAIAVASFAAAIGAMFVLGGALRRSPG